MDALHAISTLRFSNHLDLKLGSNLRVQAENSKSRLLSETLCVRHKIGWVDVLSVVRLFKRNPFSAIYNCLSS